MINKTELLRTPIAGLRFHQAWNLSVPRYQSTWAGLVKEPDNKYDPNAVKVVAHDGIMLGYIPKNQTEIVHKNWQYMPLAFVILHQPKVIVISVLIDKLMQPAEIPQLGHADIDREDK